MVVFDPMFRHARAAAPGFDLLRRLADARPLSRGALDRARRVARRWRAGEGRRRRAGTWRGSGSRRSTGGAGPSGSTPGSTPAGCSRPAAVLRLRLRVVRRRVAAERRPTLRRRQRLPQHLVHVVHEPQRHGLADLARDLAQVLLALARGAGWS